jgi:DNA-binding LytR/AlgR family response regulator
LLAIIVAVVAFCISGIFLLLLLPDQSRAAAHPIAVLRDDSTRTAAVEMAAAPATVPAVAGGNGEDLQFGRGTYAPLGGAGAPPRRFARHLPIEREGGTHFLAVDDVVAVHANAHYTYIFDGNDKLFCPLAIGNVESRLDNNRFIRVHRSHIVNIDRVVGYKRSGDNELVEMAGVAHYVVPVSRSRIGPLKLRVAALTGTDPTLTLRRRHRFAPQ